MGCACTTSSNSKTSAKGREFTPMGRLSDQQQQQDPSSGGNGNMVTRSSEEELRVAPSDTKHREQRCWDKDNNSLILLVDDDGELPPTTAGNGQGGQGRHISSVSDERPGEKGLTDALELVSGEGVAKTASVRCLMRKTATDDGLPLASSSQSSRTTEPLLRSTSTILNDLGRSRGQESSSDASSGNEPGLSDIGNSCSTDSSSFHSNSTRLSTQIGRTVPHLSRPHSSQNKEGGSKGSADAERCGHSDEAGAGELFNFGQLHVAVVDELVDERDVTKPYPKRGACRELPRSGGVSSGGRSKGGVPIGGRSSSSPLHRKDGGNISISNNERMIVNSDTIDDDGGAGTPPVVITTNTVAEGSLPLDVDSESSGRTSSRATASSKPKHMTSHMESDPEISRSAVGEYSGSRNSRDGADLFDISAGVGSEFGSSRSSISSQSRAKQRDTLLQVPPFGGWHRVKMKQLGPGASTKIRSLAFAHDVIVTATADDSTAAIYNFKNGNEVTRLSSSATSVLTFVGSSIDGRLIGSGCRDGTLTVWDGATLKKLWTIRHENAVTNFSFSDDSAYLISCAHERESHLWSMKDCQKTRAFGQQHSGPILRAIIAPKTQFVLTASTDKTIMLQGVSATKPFACFKMHRLAVVSVDMLLKSKVFPGWTPPPVDSSAPRRSAFDQDPQFECLVVSCDFRSIYVWSTDKTTTVYFHLLVADFAPHLAPYVCPRNRTQQPSKRAGGQKPNPSSKWSSFQRTSTRGSAVGSKAAPNNLNWSGCCIVMDSLTTQGRLGGNPLVAKLPKKISLVLAVVTNQRYAALLHLAGDVESLSSLPEQPSASADAVAAAAALVPPPPLDFMRTSQPSSTPIVDQPQQRQQQIQELLVQEMVNFSPLPSSDRSSGDTTASSSYPEGVIPTPNPLIAPRSEEGRTASTFLREEDNRGGTDLHLPSSSPPLQYWDSIQPVIANTPGTHFDPPLPAESPMESPWHPIPAYDQEPLAPSRTSETIDPAPIPLTTHNISLLPQAPSSILGHRFGLHDVYPIRLRSPSFAIATQGTQVAIGDTLGNITSVSVDLVDQRVFVRKSAAPPTTGAAKGRIGAGVAAI